MRIRSERRFGTILVRLPSAKCRRPRRPHRVVSIMLDCPGRIRATLSWRQEGRAPDRRANMKDAAAQSRMHIEFRVLQCVTEVAKAGSLGQASQAFPLSQSAITRSIQTLEKQLGATLFERTRTGMKLTKSGEIITRRSERALNQLSAAKTEVLNSGADEAIGWSLGRLVGSLRLRKVMAVIKVAEFQSEALAAADLDVSPATINKAVRDIEKNLGIRLFERTSRGALPTPVAEILMRHIKLAFAEIRDGIAEIAELSGAALGRLTVGSLPQSRTLLVPNAVNRLLDEIPRLRIVMQDAGFKAMLPALRCGDIDLIVGSVREHFLPGDLRSETLFHDRLVVVVRKDHPLTRIDTPSFDDLNKYDWIISHQNVPIRELFDAMVEQENLRPTSNTIESSSFESVRGLLLTSDRLCLKSQNQVRFELEHGLLVALPFPFENAHLPIGITSRRDWSPSPAAKRFMEILRELVSQSPDILKDETARSTQAG